MLRLSMTPSTSHVVIVARMPRLQRERINVYSKGVIIESESRKSTTFTAHWQSPSRAIATTSASPRFRPAPVPGVASQIDTSPVHQHQQHVEGAGMLPVLHVGVLVDDRRKSCIPQNSFKRRDDTVRPHVDKGLVDDVVAVVVLPVAERQVQVHPQPQEDVAAQHVRRIDAERVGGRQADKPRSRVVRQARNPRGHQVADVLRRPRRQADFVPDTLPAVLQFLREGQIRNRQISFRWSPGSGRESGAGRAAGGAGPEGGEYRRRSGATAARAPRP